MTLEGQVDVDPIGTCGPTVRGWQGRPSLAFISGTSFRLLHGIKWEEATLLSRR